MKQLQSSIIRSVSTVRNYEQALTQVAHYCMNQRMSLRELTPLTAVNYLEWRGEEVGQKTLDMERQAIQAMMQHITHNIDPNRRLPIVQSEYEQILNSRAYMPAQIEFIVEAQKERNAISTALAYSAGLRAHELLTLRPVNERAADYRPALDSKFEGREGAFYPVQGKGGLIREILIPEHLAQRLEAMRLAESRDVIDRNILHYEQHYNINGGNR